LNTVLVGVLIYLVVQFLIGILVSRHIANESDFLIAGRRLGVGLAGFAVFATWFGAETVVGSAGNIYENGLAGGSGEPFGYALCLFLLGLVFAAAFWRKGYTTLGDLFRVRYSRGVEKLFVLLAVPGSIFWAAAQIRAFGQVVSVISEVDVTIAISLAAVFVIIYTALGGMMANAVTDLVQGLCLIVGLVILFAAVLDVTGGFGAALALVEPDRLRFFEVFAERPALESVERWVVPILGPLFAAELVGIILSARSPGTARNAVVLGGTLYLGVGLIPVFIGLIGPALEPAIADPEQIIPHIASQYLSPLVYVLFAGALISTILSTVDSALLAASSLVSHNVIVSLKPGISEAAKLRAARICVLIFGVIAYGMALRASGIYDLIWTAVQIGSAGVVVAGTFGLFTNLGHSYSAYVSLITGMVMWASSEYLFKLATPFTVAIASALGAYLLVAALEYQFERRLQPARSGDVA
jgi:Na+/proline symporter